jgi:hypothetical protein
MIEKNSGNTRLAHHMQAPAPVTGASVVAASHSVGS